MYKLYNFFVLIDVSEDIKTKATVYAARVATQEMNEDRKKYGKFFFLILLYL